MFEALFGSKARKHPRLPQLDSPKHQEKREEELAKMKTKYIWDTDVASVKGVPMSKNVPETNDPTMEWLLKAADVALQVVDNLVVHSLTGDKNNVELKEIKNSLAALKDEHTASEKSSLESRIARTISEAKHLLSLDINTKGILSIKKELDRLKDLISAHTLSDAITSQEGLAPYKALFDTIKLDPVAESFQEDSLFSYFRVTGPNPMLIQCLSEIPNKFALTDSGYQSAMGSDDSLEAALTDNRLFMLDYHELQHIVDNPGEYDGLPKQLFAPLVLLAKPKDGEDLVPVAIQRTQDVADSGVVYFTEDKASPSYWPWQTAKSIVEMAEGNYHELFVHLARTHLFIEAFAVATYRNLAPSHPLNVLLVPHFEGTLFINNAATGSLIAKDGPIDKIFAGEITATQQASGSDRLAYDFYQNMLPTNLKIRRVEDPNILPKYPYRDDATLVWDAIKKWTTEYINIYYSHDTDVMGDTELAAWTADLEGDGKIKGFTAITTKEQLADVLTMIIFTGSAQHAAVNFPQSTLMTYAPAFSGSIWGEKDPKGDTCEQWLNTLPPIKLASDQLALLHVLGGVYYRMLGHYQTNDFPYTEWFEDKRIIGKGNALERFQDSLREIDKAIDNRNQDRSIAYTYLKPRNIPMSINI